jgi:hypothetical protein
MSCSCAIRIRRRTKRGTEWLSQSDAARPHSAQYSSLNPCRISILGISLMTIQALHPIQDPFEMRRYELCNGLQ